MNPTDTAGLLLEALLAEAQQWACGDTEDQKQLDAIDRADTPHDKRALLQNSSLVPSHLASAIADALLALDPATYSPDSAPTTSGTSMADPELHRIRDASITVVDASPQDNTPSDVYEIQVHGVSVLIRRRAEWGPATGVPYIHIEDQNEGPGLLLVEVNNTGEHEHPRPPSDGAAT
ncbi:hypothetical protein [Streptomyces sp. AVP053U2]|uniref:hypothetical protein n=1 Tax=Streptomyces sp. AVP053U2 TaxID=1737066 RepID=UPI00073B4ECE|nr:hypothetical protein [Streptomyces sp. AVP053U2]ODA70277.1 hypothetical protein APS67_005503 [Streptomyces sp. AVP053U2]